ncbi:hypothetical protein COO58_20070 [Micromonospora sp. WMMA1996]|nr:hypothetical protein COO58_20070 [Micromonospora sp. WMMA1996]
MRELSPPRSARCRPVPAALRPFLRPAFGPAARRPGRRSHPLEVDRCPSAGLAGFPRRAEGPRRCGARTPSWSRDGRSCRPAGRWPVPAPGRRSCRSRRR